MEMTATSISSAVRVNWPEFLRSTVMLVRRTGVKPEKGLFSGPGMAEPAFEADFPEPPPPKGRKLRRVRREGKDVPPPPPLPPDADADGCAEDDGEGGGGACCGEDEGPVPEGVLFGGTRPKWGTDSELGREELMAAEGFRAILGEKRGI